MPGAIPATQQIVQGSHAFLNFFSPKFKALKVLENRAGA